MGDRGGLSRASPYVQTAHANESYGKHPGYSHTGRRRPETKAQLVAVHHSVDPGAADLAAAVAATNPPWESLYKARQQLDRETPTEGNTCKGAVACLQVGS